MSTAPTFDDIQSDIWHLYHLLDALTEHMVGMDHTRDGKRDPAMDRASSLAWIARDVAHKIASETDHCVDVAAKSGGAS